MKFSKILYLTNLENLHFYYYHKMLAKLNFVYNTHYCIPETEKDTSYNT